VASVLHSQYFSWTWNYRPEEWKILKELQLKKEYTFNEDMIVIKPDNNDTAVPAK
jgi:hypothetical protein